MQSCNPQQPTANRLPLCPECSTKPARLASGICWTCYLNGGDELDVDYADRPLSPWPTDFAPGTAEKVAVMEERFRLGYALFSPDDAPLDWGGLPPEQYADVRDRQLFSEPSYRPLNTASLARKRHVA